MRSRLASFVALLGALACSPALADDAFDACLRATPEGTRCGEEWIAREQARLDAALKGISEVAEGDIAADIAAEQKAWETFRDLSCKFKLDEGFGGASGINGYHACRAQVIAERAAAVEAYVNYIDN